MGIRDVPKHVPPTTQVAEAWDGPEATCVCTLCVESRANRGHGIRIDYRSLESPKLYLYNKSHLVFVIAMAPLHS